MVQGVSTTFSVPTPEELGGDFSAVSGQMTKGVNGDTLPANLLLHWGIR